MVMAFLRDQSQPMPSKEEMLEFLKIDPSALEHNTELGLVLGSVLFDDTLASKFESDEQAQAFGRLLVRVFDIK